MGDCFDSKIDLNLSVIYVNPTKILGDYFYNSAVRTLIILITY